MTYISYIAIGLLVGIVILTVIQMFFKTKIFLSKNSKYLEKDNKYLKLQIKALKKNFQGQTDENKYYKLIYDNFSNPVLVIKNNKFINCNKAALQVLNLNNNNQIYNLHPSSISPEYQPDGNKSNVKADEMIKIAYEKGSHFFEWVHINSEKNPFTVIVYLTVIKLKNQELIITVWHNITKFKNIEAELEARERKHITILDSFTDEVYICTPEYKIDYLNKAMIEYIGFDAKGKTCYKVIYKKNEKCEWCVFDKLKKNKSIVYEHYNSIKDKYYQMKNILLEDGSKLSTFHDITVLKKSEKQLINSEQQFRDLFNFSPTPMLIHSNDKIIMANNAAAIFFETTDTTQIIGKPIIDFIHPEQVEKVKQNLNKVYKNGWHYGAIIHKLVTLKPNIKYAEVTGFLTKYKNNPAVHIVFTDITKKQQTEYALKESEEKYKKLIEDSSIGIGIFKDTETRFANNALLQMFGYKEYDAFIKKPISNYFSNNSKILLQERIDKNNNGIPVNASVIFEIIRKDGLRRLLKIRASNIIINNEKLRHITFIDITDQLKAEKELKNSETKLKELNAQKDKFFSILAHDLKNPFNTLLGFSELLLGNHKTYDKEKRGKFLNIIHENAKNIHNLLNNLLLWSRNQRNKISYKPEQINLYNLILNNIELYNPMAKTKKINLYSFVENAIEVYADYNMIDTVIRNLLSNAIKFTPQNGTITIKSNQLTKPKELIEISIEDTGVGISKENLKKLFNISESISTEGTENEKGTGLGLVLCKDFIEKNNGKINVVSSLKEGSIFTFTLNKKQ